MKNQNFHLYDSELQGLSRRGYQGGMPMELLSDVFVAESNGNYFHTVDGRFCKIWKIEGIDASVLNDTDHQEITADLMDVLNKFPAGSSGQLIRHTHRDVRPIIQKYLSGLDKDTEWFAMEIANSIVERQKTAAESSSGFFTKLTDSIIQKMRADALAEVNDEDEDVRTNATQAIEREMREGRFPFVTDLYLCLMWEPEYRFGKLVEKSWQTAIASLGLADANQLVKTAYDKHAKAFELICYEIGQALATYQYIPSEVTGQGLVNLKYQLLNPVRSYQIEPPTYRQDVSITDILTNTSNGLEHSINQTGNFSTVITEQNGWTINDSGHEFYIRPVSLLGKPGKSFPGMIQMAMAGIESEALITINWHIPSRLAVQARLIARGRLISSKETMRMGDKETRRLQAEDLEWVKGQVSSENVNNRQQIFDVSMHVNLMGFDKEAIEDQAARLQNMMWKIGYVERQRGDAAVRNSLPLNYRPQSMKLFRRDTPHLTESLAHLCPIYLEYQGVTEPAVLLNNRSGQPIYLDLWGDSVATAHSLICGTTGSGKSFAFNNLLMALKVKYRPKVWIIDKGDSYESLCVVLDGNYIRLSTEQFEDATSGRIIDPICINPFSLKRLENGLYEMPTKDDMFFIVQLLAMMMTKGDGKTSVKGNVTPVTIALLYEALDNFYHKWLDQQAGKEPTFSDFIKELNVTNYKKEEGSSIAEALSLYYGKGPFSTLFDGYLKVDWENDFTVLETQRMASSPALGPVTIALFRQIDMYSKYILKKNRKKIIAVDEAWATLSDPTAAKALSGFYREMRKYNAGCLLISQRVGDFVQLIKAESSDGGGAEGIFENTSHFFFLACSESDYELAKTELSFSDEEISLWRSLSSLPPIFSEVFYRLRTKSNKFYSGVFRLFSTPVTIWVASSSPDDFYMREKETAEQSRLHGYSESEARRRAIIKLSKSHPYGARYNVSSAS